MEKTETRLLRQADAETAQTAPSPKEKQLTMIRRARKRAWIMSAVFTGAGTVTGFFTIRSWPNPLWVVLGILFFLLFCGDAAGAFKMGLDLYAAEGRVLSSVP